MEQRGFPYMLESGILMVPWAEDRTIPFESSQRENGEGGVHSLTRRYPSKQSAGCELFGISRNELYRKMRKYGLLRKTE